jgi:uncharacterized damage-inducible protein DinB
MSERAGHPSVDFVHFFDYLLLARARLFEWIRAQSSAAYTQTFSIGLGSIRATLLHVAASEWSYCQRLAGTDFAPGDIPFTVTSFPAFDALAAAWGEHGQTVRYTLARIADPSRTITYVSRAFSPPIRIETTAGGIAGQLLFHEVHHRAQVMAMLRQLGVKAENLDYSVLMAKRTPAG